MWDWSSDVCFSDLAVTQDAYVQRRLSTMLRQSKAARLADRTQISLPVLIRLSGDIAAPDPAIERVTRIEVEFQSIGGASVTAITAIGDAARGCSDPALAGALRRSATNLRRAAALPTGLSAAYEALCELNGQADRKSGVDGKGLSRRVRLGGSRYIKKKK